MHKHTDKLTRKALSTRSGSGSNKLYWHIKRWSLPLAIHPNNDAARQRHQELYNSRHTIPAGTTYIFEDKAWAGLFYKIFGSIADCKPVMASKKYLCSLTDNAVVDGVLLSVSQGWPTNEEIPIIKWPLVDAYRSTGNTMADDIHRLEGQYLEIANNSIEANTVYKFDPTPGRGGAIWAAADYKEEKVKQIIQFAFEKVGGKWVGDHFVVPKKVVVDNLLFDFLLWHFKVIDTRSQSFQQINLKKIATEQSSGYLTIPQPSTLYSTPSSFKAS